MAFLIDPHLPQKYSGFVREEPLDIISFNSYNKDNPRLKRLRAQEFNTSLGMAAAFSVGGTAISAFDSIVETLGLVEKDTIEELMADHAPHFANFFLRHRDNFQIAGDLTSAVLLGGVGAAAVRSTGLIGRGMRGVFGDRVTPFLSTGRTAQSLSKIAVERAKLIGSRPQATNLEIDSAFLQARGLVAKRRLADFAIEAVAAESAIAAGLHGSEFLFPDEMSLMENLVWIGGTNVIIGAGFFAHGWRTVRKMSQVEAGPLKKKAVNADDLPLTDLPANMYSGQGNAMAIWGQQLDVIARQRTQAGQAADPETLANIASAQTAVRERITEAGQRAAKGRPIPEINDSFELNSGQAKTIGDAVSKNPEIFGAIQSIENFDLAKDITTAFQQNKLDRWLRHLETESSRLWHKIRNIEQSALVTDPRNFYGEKIVALDELTPAQEQYRKQLMDQIHELQQQIEATKRLTPGTIELDGSFRLGADRPAIWQDGERPLSQPMRGEGDEVAVRAEVDGDKIPLEADVAGRLKAPSTFCPLGRGAHKKLGVRGKAQSIIGEIGLVATANTLVELGLESLGDLQRVTNSAIPPLFGESESILALRGALKNDADVPNQFMAFGKGQDKTHLKFRQGRPEGYSTPYIVSRG